MKKALILLAALSLPSFGLSLRADPASADRTEIGNLVTEGIPPVPQALSDRLLQYLNTRSATLQGWDPVGGGVYITTRFAETAQVHLVAKAGGDRRQLTFFPEPVNEAAPRPAVGAGNPPGFLYTKDAGGGEFYQIFFYNAQTGTSTLLTDGKSRNGAPHWDHKGDQFAYYSTQRNGKDWDIYLGTPDKPNGRPLLANAGTWVPIDWSPDDRKLLVIHEISAAESELFILDAGSRKLTPIHPTDAKISYDTACWSPDGKGVYLTSDEGSEFHQLRYYDASRETLKILTPNLPWDVEEVEVTPPGAATPRIAFTTNEGGIRKLYLLDPGTQTYEPLPDLPVGQIGGLFFNPDGTKLGMTLDTPQNPADVYVLSLADNSLERWTQSEVGGLNTATFVTPTLISYPTFDQDNGQPRQIPAFYYQPPAPAAPPGGKAPGPIPAPVVIYIHGGPEDQFAPVFSSMIPFFVNELGIAVIAPNVRGSTGYGKSYMGLDDGQKREDSVQDIGKLLDWIAQQPELDAKRVIVFGGSYGGYMTLASLVHFGDRLKGGIDVCGFSNFVSFLEHTEDYRRDLRRVEYGDERDPKMRQFLTDISPLTHADKIVDPLFIVQGANDPRVPASEADQILDAIHKNQGTAWYLLAKDEGHGFRKKANRDYLNEAIVLFLQQYLLK